MKGYNLPVAEVLYIVGRTDQITGTNPKWGAKKRCLWTGPKATYLSKSLKSIIIWQIQVISAILYKQTKREP
jgi:hypothetical protein